MTFVSHILVLSLVLSLALSLALSSTIDYRVYIHIPLYVHYKTSYYMYIVDSTVYSQEQCILSIPSATTVSTYCTLYMLYLHWSVFWFSRPLLVCALVSSLPG